MKKFLLSFFTLISFYALAQTPFTQGNLVVVRVGSGGAALTNQSQLINLVEMTPGGVEVQTITLPYTNAMATGGNNKICAQGSSSNDANLTISANGAYFVLAGYNSDTGIATISGVAGVKRVFCRIAMDGTWDTKTLMDTAKSKGNARCAASNDGTGFWLIGNNTGVRYVPYLSTGEGTDTATIVSTTVTNCRTIQPFGGNLIVGTGSGAVRVGTITGFPTNSGNAMVQLPGLSTTITANSVYMTSLPGGPAGLNTLYVPSDAAPNGIKKYCLNATTGNWDSVGVIDAASTYRGMTGTTTGSVVTLYAVRGNSPLTSVVDAAGYNVAPSITTTSTVSAAPTNTAYRGVQLVPTSLPIRLLSFNAAKNDNGTANVFWSVNGDDDVVSYVVEKSINGKDFIALSTIKASGLNNYSFNDNEVLKVNTLYRVKFVSKNGKYTYSNIVNVSPLKSIKFEVFPNPAKNNLIVSYPKLNTNANISIYTLDGRNVMSLSVKAGTTQNSLDISSLNNGSYLVTIFDEEGNKTTKTIIKN